MNIAKAKNVDRVFTLLELDDDLMPQEATVKWYDSERKYPMKL